MAHTALTYSAMSENDPIKGQIVQIWPDVNRKKLNSLLPERSPVNSTFFEHALLALFHHLLYRKVR
jgi:hypothetical protein